MEGKGRNPNKFSHPQFRISRNMPGLLESKNFYFGIKYLRLSVSSTADRNLEVPHICGGRSLSCLE